MMIYKQQCMCLVSIMIISRSWNVTVFVAFIFACSLW